MVNKCTNPPPPPNEEPPWSRLNLQCINHLILNNKEFIEDAKNYLLDEKNVSENIKELIINDLKKKLPNYSESTEYFFYYVLNNEKITIDDTIDDFYDKLISYPLLVMNQSCHWAYQCSCYIIKYKEAYIFEIFNISLSVDCVRDATAVFDGSPYGNTCEITDSGAQIQNAIDKINTNKPITSRDYSKLFLPEEIAKQYSIFLQKLQMRNKAEILKHKKNANNLTKKQKLSNILSGKTRSKSYASNSNPNIYNLPLFGKNILIDSNCNKKIISTPSYYSDVPGNTKLTYDYRVPVTLKEKRAYPSGGKIVRQKYINNMWKKMIW